MIYKSNLSHIFLLDISFIVLWRILMMLKYMSYADPVLDPMHNGLGQILTNDAIDPTRGTS